MAVYRVPVLLFPCLGIVCFALLCGRAVNSGCAEAGEVSGEVFKDCIVEWEEKELQEQSLLPYYAQGSL